jgi:ABC-type nitrate/sulfonate/bicarbonate transport system ATPase subunit
VSVALTVSPASRTDVFATLTGSSRAAATGNGATVLVLGEAGIGKTTLLRAGADDAAEHGLPL